MPAPITVLDFARIAMVAYEPETPRTDGGFARLSPMERRLSGFQGAIYRRANGAGLDWVVGIAGTQTEDKMDLLADAGFAGATTGNLLGKYGGAATQAGTTVLLGQCADATKLVTQARAVMAKGDRLVLTGHSLGGGICQILAARLGLPAVCFNPPTVTAVAGVEGDYRRTRPAVFCIQVKNDPINRTSMFGRWLGVVLSLPSARAGGDAHKIELTVGELGPSGPFTGMGALTPFDA